MNYTCIYEKFGKKAEVRAAIIGSGAYATAMVTQSVYTKFLKICIVADISLKKAYEAYEKSEIPLDQVVCCRTLEEAKFAMQQEKWIATDNPDIVFGLDIDVVAEATGVPEAGARNAMRALEAQMHLVMVNKETDSVLGPYFHKLFAQKGLVYTPVDGDQPAQLMQLVDWARLIGLEILCAGKARDGEFIYERSAQSVTLPADGKGVPEPVTVHIPPEKAHYLEFIPEGKTEEYILERTKLLEDLPGPGGFDYCELVNIANSTGLVFNASEPLKCALRVNELPIVYTLRENGGLLESANSIDIMTLLRTPEEASMGGGVFLVVKSKNDYSQHILLTKSLIGNYDGSAAVLIQPYHLCGVESSTSLLTTALLGVPTGSRDRTLRYDIVRVAKQDLPAGTLCTHDRDPNLRTIIAPAVHRGPLNPVPGHMLNGNRLACDVKAGELITYEMVNMPEDSLLWELRLKAEALFLGRI